MLRVGTAAPRSGGCLGTLPGSCASSRPTIFPLILQEHVRWCGMTSGTKALTAWAVDETRRFFRAFHKHGTEFDKVGRLARQGFVLRAARLCLWCIEPMGLGCLWDMAAHVGPRWLLTSDCLQAVGGEGGLRGLAGGCTAPPRDC